MALTPEQARTRLALARQKMHLATVLHRDDREGFDANAGITGALLEVIQLLEDALA